MRNIISYLKKYGNTSFSDYPFNETDSLLLCQITYLNLESFIPNVDDNLEDISLIDFINNKNVRILTRKTFDEKRNTKLLFELTKTTRYGKLLINNFQQRFDVDIVEQFCAMTFVFDDFIYVAYRGTDMSLIGWYEDFNMAFLDVIPAQDDATRYLEKICNKTDKKMYIGGHSKGGNLAVYSSLFISNENISRIINIYDYDGPGFNKDIFSNEEYLRIESKIKKYTCKESIVGMILCHSEKVTFIDSKGLSILQHDPYNWKIKKDGSLKRYKNANLISRVFERTVKEFLEKTPLENRKQLVEISFTILMEHPLSDLFDVAKNPIRYYRGIKRRYNALPHVEKVLVKFLFKRYVKLWNDNMKMYLKRRFNFGNKK